MMDKKMREYKIFILLIALSVLSACGYHLRGGIADLPQKESELMQKIYLHEASAELSKSFKKNIKSFGGTLVKRFQASIIISIIKEESDKYSIALNEDNKSTEYEISYYLTYEIHDKDEKLLTTQKLKIYRQYYDSQNDVISRAKESDMIRREIYQDAVRTVMSHLTFALKKIYKANEASVGSELNKKTPQ